MGAPTGANGSCCRAPREFLIGATRLLHREAHSELLLVALRGLKCELLEDPYKLHLGTPIGAPK